MNTLRRAWNKAAIVGERPADAPAEVGVFVVEKGVVHD